MYTAQYKSRNYIGKLGHHCPAHATLAETSCLSYFPTKTYYLSVYTGCFTVLGLLCHKRHKRPKKVKKTNVSFVPWAANFAEHMPTLSMKFSILD